MDGVKERVLSAVAKASGRKSDEAYVSDPRANFIETLDEGQISAVLDEISRGDGGELVSTNGRIKFCAAHSSSALAANSFGPWFDAPQSLAVLGMTDFESVELERKFPTGLGGNAPNLDVFLASSTNPVAIESKFTEYLGTKPAVFRDSYAPLVSEISEAGWGSLFEDLRSNPRLYDQIDVAQLVKHYLGLKRAVLNGEFDRLTLVYLFWEPTNVGDFPEFALHRKQLEEIKGRVDDPSVPFRSLTYLELWEEWDRAELPTWFSPHLDAIRDRYEVAV